ncbi:hypothetical protein K5X82_08515 [Halosquirtibacter xylanolyticus]|uniref:glycerophosphodiester phosphodiesterase family protein n=1 Tax=Halosquirtibacter xylanolyticus TaxID=3374599 RepID=UPI00374946DA|nr:hypothetical protein K5X82_08515 [Prolixibacteraceae bacterium]
MFVLLCWLGFPILLRSQIRIVANGGASYYKPSNTVVAVRLAWEYYADGIMVDVFKSKDQQWFAFRPEGIGEYTTKMYDLRSMKSKKITSLSLRSKFSNTGLSYHISKLEDVISILPQGKYFILSLDDKITDLRSLMHHLMEHRNAFYFRFVASDWSTLEYLTKHINVDHIYCRWNGKDALGITMEKMIELGIYSLVIDKTQMNPQVMAWANKWNIKLHLSLSEHDNGVEVIRDYPNVKSLFTTRPRWVRSSLLPKNDRNRLKMQTFGLME